MPTLGKLFEWLVMLGLAVSVHAYPHAQQEQRSHVAVNVRARQEPASSSLPSSVPAAAPTAAPAGGLTDIDILQFALTAEHLESAFYAQGFAKFPSSDFQALGLSDANVAALKAVGQTEAVHVSTLLSAIASAGFTPVQPCQYNFGFTTAQAMVATARVLEAVGVSAYLGAAPLISSPAVLSVAATIATVESRHQTFIRSAAGAVPVPAAFDTPLGPRAVFTLAAAFIQSCPPGSNLNVQAFPAIALTASNITSGQNLVLQDPAQPTGASFCGYINQGLSPFGRGGVQYTPLSNGQCTVPQNLAGETYMIVTNAEAATDDVILAGPSVLEIS